MCFCLWCPSGRASPPAAGTTCKGSAGDLAGVDVGRVCVPVACHPQVPFRDGDFLFDVQQGNPSGVRTCSLSSVRRRQMSHWIFPRHTLGVQFFASVEVEEVDFGQGYTTSQYELSCKDDYCSLIREGVAEAAVREVDRHGGKMGV